MTRESDETRATLRRLVETQAAALREVTAQRDALLAACAELRGWAVMADDGWIIQPPNVNPQLAAALQRADAAMQPAAAAGKQ